MTKTRPPFWTAGMVTGVGLLTVLVTVAIFAPIFLSESANKLTASTRLGPSWSHPLGTNNFGQDMLARSLVAARLTLPMAAAAALLAIAGGLTIGVGAFIAPPRVRELLLRLLEVGVAYPTLIVALLIAAILQPGVSTTILAMGIAGMPGFGRITANLVQSVSRTEYVTAARLLGVSPVRVAIRHMLPNMAEPLLVLSTTVFAGVLVEISALSFIGLGVQSPQYDFGGLLNDTLQSLYTHPIAIVGPAVMIVSTGLAVMLIGDAAAARSNPRTVRRLDRQDSYPATQDEAVDDECALVRVRDLHIRTADGLKLVDGVSLYVDKGEVVGLVGESGSGKSLTAMAIAGLTSAGLHTSAEQLRVGSMNMLGRPDSARLAKEISLIYQDPGTSFNPSLRMGTQLTEVLRTHLGMTRRNSRRTMISALDSVGISQPAVRLQQHPNQLSGGMRQRAMIAASMANRPNLLIADEPTTALDVTVQLEVLRQFRDIHRSGRTSMLFISHDLGVVQELCDRVLIMREGSIVEELSAAELQSGEAKHPYTRTLLEAVPVLNLTGSDRQCDPPPITGALTTDARTNGTSGDSYSVRARGVDVRFGKAQVLTDVAVDVPSGCVVGLVGESGSGKSTLAKVLVGSLKATSGDVTVAGQDMSTLHSHDRRMFARKVQLIPQDPYSSLSPRRTVGGTLAEALNPAKPDPTRYSDEIAAALEAMRIDPALASRYPHQFSGGQRQRIAIARALIVQPELIIADEITSALDVSVQAEVIELLQSLRRTMTTSMLFVTHNLALAQQLCDSVIVMNRGMIVEHGPINSVYRTPKDAYTRDLLASVPGSPEFTLDRRPTISAGELISTTSKQRMER